MAFRAEPERGSAPPGAGQVDYRLVRQSVVADFRAGRLARHEVCDAHPELLRAARHVGETTSQPCPICGDSKVVLVTYVFGPRLPAHGRCVTTLAEIRKLARQDADLAGYVVEVCPDCRWNHLARSFPLGRAGRRR